MAKLFSASVQVLKRRASSILSGLILIGSTAILAGCSMVQTEEYLADRSKGCQGTAGSYFLAKSKLKIVVEETSPTNTTLVSLDVERIPDRRRSYCLDFLGSITSDDTLIVNKNDKGLLDLVKSTADDKSEEILTTFIETGKQIALASLRSNLRTDVAKTIPYTDTFDPFDDDEMLVLNHNLKRFGMCVVVPRAKTVASLDAMSNYCNRRITMKQRDAALLGSSRATTVVPSARSVSKAAESKTAKTHGLPPANYSNGILYKPRLPYSVYVLKQKNRRLHGGWYVLDKTEQYMENEAPVLSVGVNRTFFAKKDTTLNFDQGALQNVTIDKGSELVGFASIPLKVAQAIVNLPAEIIQLRIQVGNNQQELLANRAALYRAQADLLTAQATLLETQRANPGINTNSGFGADATGFRQSLRSDAGGVQSCTTECRAYGGEASYCQSQCSCQLLCQGQSNTAACAQYCSVSF